MESCTREPGIDLDDLRRRSPRRGPVPGPEPVLRGRPGGGTGARTGASPAAGTPGAAARRSWSRRERREPRRFTSWSRRARWGPRHPRRYGAALSGCGLNVQSPDLFLLTRTGPGAKLTLEVGDGGTMRCNGGHTRNISSARLIAARDLADNLGTDAQHNLDSARPAGLDLTVSGSSSSRGRSASRTATPPVIPIWPRRSCSPPRLPSRFAGSPDKRSSGVAIPG